MSVDAPCEGFRSECQKSGKAWESESLPSWHHQQHQCPCPIQPEADLELKLPRLRMSHDKSGGTAFSEMTKGARVGPCSDECVRTSFAPAA